MDSFLKFLEDNCPGDDAHSGCASPEKPLLERCGLCASIYEAHLKSMSPTLEDFAIDLAAITPGPWRTGPRLHYNMFASVFGADGHLIVNLGDGGNGIARQTANGNLIAAAPTLAAKVHQLEAEVAHWKMQYGCLKIQEEAALKERDAAQSQVEELKKSLEKTVAGAIRFIDESLCETHKNRVKMQSAGEFIAEHAGKCVLCFQIRIEDLKKALYEECRGISCGKETCYVGYRSCTGCEERAKAAHGPGWGQEKPVCTHGDFQTGGPDDQPCAKCGGQYHRGPI